MNNFVKRNLVFSVIVLCLGLFVGALYGGDSFEEKVDSVQIDIEKILGVNKKELTSRIVWHPIETNREVPYHARKRWLMFTPEEEAKIGGEVIRQLQNLEAFYHSEESEARVGKIASKLREAIGGDLQEDFYLADTDIVNAFCYIDGTLVVTRGALEYLSDDDLAFVIAHEYGHALAHHGTEGLTKAILAEAGSKYAAEIVVGEERVDFLDWKKKLVGKGCLLVSRLAFALPYSRVMENEADALGMVFLKKAGYPIETAVSAMEHLASSSEKEAAAWEIYLSTHPSFAERIERLRTYCRGEELIRVSPGDEGYPLDWSYRALTMLLKELTYEELPSENSTGEVFFVPGIFMKEAENYLSCISEVFPSAKLTVVQWKAVNRGSWSEVVFRAEMLGRYLALNRFTSQEKLDNLTLVGHSLGCQAVLEAIRLFAENGRQVNAAVFLGGALPYHDESLELMQSGAKRGISIFYPGDRILKYAYASVTKTDTPALGFLGAQKKVKGLEEYRLPEEILGKQEMQVFSQEMKKSEELQREDDNGSVEDSSGGWWDKLSDSALESHRATMYLQALKLVFGGEVQKEKTKVDHMVLREKYKSSLSLPVPSKGGVLQEEYHDWEMIYFYMPKIGKIFGKKDPSAENDPPTQGKFLVGVIRDPYGSFCSYSRSQEEVQAKFNEIKAAIDAQIASVEE